MYTCEKESSWLVSSSSSLCDVAKSLRIVLFNDFVGGITRKSSDYVQHDLTLSRYWCVLSVEGESSCSYSRCWLVTTKAWNWAIEILSFVMHWNCRAMMISKLGAHLFNQVLVSCFMLLFDTLQTLQLRCMWLNCMVTQGHKYLW